MSVMVGKRFSVCSISQACFRRCRRQATRCQTFVPWAVACARAGGALLRGVIMTAYQLTRLQRKVCYVFLGGCFTGILLMLLTIYSLPGTFNMRIIPSLQEINAMFIITSASMTCDQASLPHSSVAKLDNPYHIPAFVKEEKYTIIINTFRRNALLLQSLDHYSSMRNVDKIVVFWSNVGVEPPDIEAIVQPKVPIVIKRMEAINLSLRFTHSDDITTQGVFNVDDDLIIDEEDIEHAFSVWKYHPHGLVGFTPRTHVESTKGSYKYYRLPLFVGNYSLILTNAAFMHRHYLGMFAKQLPQEMKDFIDKYRNCEDIAMNFIVNNHCKCAGVFYVKPKHHILDYGGVVGLSRRGQHAEIRDSCMGLLSRLYPDVALKWVRCRY